MAKLAKIEGENWVTKSNDLIMSRYDLSLAEQRLIVAVATIVQPDDTDFQAYDLPVIEYAKLINSDVKNEYREMKKLADGLMSKPFFVNNDDGGWTCYNWFSSIRYMPRKGFLRCKFHPDLKPFLLSLKKRFTSYQLENVLRLKSKYSIRLYEILKSWVTAGRFKIELAELRVLLSIPENYRWDHIKKRILEPARRELSSTDIRFTYTTIKRGRRVHGIKFDITDTGQLALELEPTAPKSDSDTPDTVSEKNPAENLLDLVPGDEKKSVKKLIADAQKKYPAAYIREKIQLANQQKNLKNYPGWLRAALENDYKKSEKSEKNETQKSKKTPTKKSVSGSVSSASDDKKTEQGIAEQQKIRKKFAALPENEREKWIARARAEAAECGGADLLPRGLILIHAADLWAENTSAI